MENQADYQVQDGISMEAAMGLKNFVPELLAQKGIDKNTFIAYCLLEKLGQDTAYRFLRGEVDFSTKTLNKVRKILGVNSIAEIVDYVPCEGEQ
ncbi:MAG: hypothetical protein PHQ40_00270 [Anaerolineaceae bacterium]|nr:hypothetical protein [Anaerolineaceae bacterium]MDD5367490.1 hypothetical protein [Anaerolineaceae bacterium]